MRQERLGAVDDAPEVDVDDALDLLEAHLLDVAGEGDAGVVEDQVDDAELGGDGVGVGEHGGAVGDVEALLVHLRAELTRAAGGLGQAGGVDVADGEPRAAAGELVGSARPMPEPAPVTTATLPWICRSCGLASSDEV